MPIIKSIKVWWLRRKIRNLQVDKAGYEASIRAGYNAGYTYPVKEMRLAEINLKLKYTADDLEALGEDLCLL